MWYHASSVDTDAPPNVKDMAYLVVLKEAQQGPDAARAFWTEARERLVGHDDWLGLVEQSLGTVE